MKTENKTNKTKKILILTYTGIVAVPIAITYGVGLIAYETLNRVTFGKFRDLADSISTYKSQLKRKFNTRMTIKKLMKNEPFRQKDEAAIKDFYKRNIEKHGFIKPVYKGNVAIYIDEVNQQNKLEKISQSLKKAGFNGFEFYPSGSAEGLFDAIRPANTHKHTPNPLPIGVDKKDVHDVVIFNSGNYIFHDGRGNIYDNSSKLEITNDAYKFVREVKMNGQLMNTRV